MLTERMHPSTKGVRGRRHQVTPHLESAGSWKQKHDDASAQRRAEVLDCAGHLAHAAELAASAARSGDPARGAAYLAHALQDLAPALARLRRLARTRE